MIAKVVSKACASEICLWNVIPSHYTVMSVYFRKNDNREICGSGWQTSFIQWEYGFYYYLCVPIAANF